MVETSTVQWRVGALFRDQHVDPGFLHGLGVFETLGVSYGRVLRPQAHLRRISEGALHLALPPVAKDQFKIAMRELAGAVSSLSEARLRLTWTPGANGEGELHGIAEPYLRPESVRLHRSRYLRNEKSAVAGIKSIAYVENLLALREAQAAGADEPVFANTLGHISEGATTNIFFEIDDVLLTPPLVSGCLPGTARAMCIEWGRRQGIPIIESSLEMDVLASVSSAAVTSALKGVLPVSQIDGRKLNTGPLIAELCRIYDTMRESELIFPE